MKKIYTIDKIPSFRFEVDYPSGLSSVLKHIGKADIFLFGKWVGWDNVRHKEEPNYLNSIEKFFSFLNYPKRYNSSDIARLDTFNKSETAKNIFRYLAGWIVDFEDCRPNSDELIIKNGKNYFKLTPSSFYVHELKRTIHCYDFDYFHTGSPRNIEGSNKIMLQEGLDMIDLIRLSFLAQIYNYEKEQGIEIRMFSGHYYYKEDLINFCVQKKLI